MREMDYLEEADEDTQEGKFLTFQLNGEVYGIEIRNVLEIIGIQKVTPLPDLPHYFKGVINLRGKVIPVLDVRLKFGIPPLDYHDRTCIVVAKIEDYEVGLIVDRVDEVIDIPQEKIELPPKISKNSKSKYLQGMGNLEDKVVILLDVSKFLLDQEISLVDELSAETA